MSSIRPEIDFLKSNEVLEKKTECTVLRREHFRAKCRYLGVLFERRFQPLSVGGFFSNQRESISRCPKSPFPSKTQNRQIARTSPLNQSQSTKTVSPDERRRADLHNSVLDFLTFAPSFTYSLPKSGDKFPVFFDFERSKLPEEELKSLRQGFVAKSIKNSCAEFYGDIPNSYKVK